MLSIGILVIPAIIAAAIFTSDRENRELREYYMTEYPEYRRHCQSMPRTPTAFYCY